MTVVDDVDRIARVPEPVVLTLRGLVAEIGRGHLEVLGPAA